MFSITNALVKGQSDRNDDWAVPPLGLAAPAVQLGCPSAEKHSYAYAA